MFKIKNICFIFLVAFVETQAKSRIVIWSMIWKRIALEIENNFGQPFYIKIENTDQQTLALFKAWPRIWQQMIAFFVKSIWKHMQAGTLKALKGPNLHPTQGPRPRTPPKAHGGPNPSSSPKDPTGESHPRIPPSPKNPTLKQNLYQI